ncbi:unnamed protein product, partial [Clonostachys chloroleuca]
LLASRAIADDAFSAGYSSIDEVLQPGTLEEGIDYTPLEWREDMLDEPIIPITYHQYWELWNIAMLVAGQRDNPRPSAMRVGAGGRLDGTLTGALRNFILSNSTDVFEKSYQPVHVRENLMKIAFGPAAGETDAVLKRLHNSFTQSDPFAPTYITPDDVSMFEQRNDIRRLRALQREAKEKGTSSSTEAKKLTGRIAYILRTLDDLRIKQRRGDYFKEVNLLRSTGQSTMHLRDELATNPRRKMNKESSRDASELAPHVVNEPWSISTWNNVVRYLKGIELPGGLSRRIRCLICCKRFGRNCDLTRHVAGAHTGMFREPFDCPECRRAGKQKCAKIKSPASWSSHVERGHGEVAPNPKWIRVEAYCALCTKVCSDSGFVLHFRQRHSNEDDYKGPCPECLRQGRSHPAFITGFRDWVKHVQSVHDGDKKGAIIKSTANIDDGDDVDGEWE